MHFVNNLEGIKKKNKGFGRDIARQEKINLLKVIGYKTCVLSRRQGRRRSQDLNIWGAVQTKNNHVCQNITW